MEYRKYTRKTTLMKKFFKFFFEKLPNSIFSSVTFVIVRIFLRSLSYFLQNHFKMYFFHKLNIKKTGFVFIQGNKRQSLILNSQFKFSNAIK